MSLGSLSPAVISNLVDLADFGNILMLVNEITLTLAFTWAPGDVGTLLSAIFIKMGQSPKYSSIYFSTRLEVMLLGSKLRKGLLSYAPEIPLKMLMSYRFPPTTGRFSLYSIPSRFIYNFWIPMIFIAIITGAWLIIWLVEFLLRSPQKGMTPHFICRKVRVAFQNFLIGLIYCNFGDIMMYVILEFQGTKYYTNNDWFSWILALLFLILIVVMLCRHVHVLINYQRLKKAEKTSPQAKKQLTDYKYNREGLSLWFSSFKDTSFVNQAFLMFFMFRVLLCYILFGAMTESPHAESILVFCITVIFIIFACIKRPFNSTIDFVQYILYEVVTLLLNISLMILATLDAKLDLSLSLRNTMSEIILSTPFIFGFLSPIFLITKLVLLVIKYYKAQPGAKVDPNTSAVNNSVSHEGLIGFDNSRGGDQIEKEMGRVRPRQRKADRLDETVHSIGEMHDNPSAATLHPPSSYNNYNNGNSYNNGNGGYSGNGGNGAVLKKKVFANNGGANYGTPYSQQQYQPQYNQQQQERNYQYDQRQEGNNQYNQRQQGNYQQNQRQERNYQYDQQQEGNYQYNQRQERNYQYNEQQEGDYQYNQRQERNYQYNDNNNGQRGQRNYGGNYERNNYRGRSHERANEYVRTGERRVISQTERGAKRQQVERMEEGPVRGGAYARSRVWHRKLNRDAYRGGQLPGRVQDEGQETNFRSQIESRNRYV